VAFREARILDAALQEWPGARGYAWYQDFHDSGEPFTGQVETLIRHRATPVLVSDWHELLWIKDLQSHGYGDRLPTRRIYNAIPDDLQPDSTPVDPDKFLYFSSPHKGLGDTVDFFARFAAVPELRDVRLHIANPGYRKIDFELPEDRVVMLGPLPWKGVIQELRSAFMVLHYNLHFPETFGLVHAEADAVGTPWISGELGANTEVCADPDEVMDLSDPDAVIERIVRWKTEGRPEVDGAPWFRLSAIAKEWEELFGE
jgi:glycosyltransferase involved in cell wall biosynthesis